MKTLKDDLLEWKDYLESVLKEISGINALPKALSPEQAFEVLEYSMRAEVGKEVICQINKMLDAHKDQS